jgi:hypothetical protein
MPITIQVPINTSGILPPPINSRKFTECCK